MKGSIILTPRVVQLSTKRVAIENLEVFFKRVAWSLLLLHSKRRNLRLFHHSEFRPTFSIPEGEMPVYVIIINLIWG